MSGMLRVRTYKLGTCQLGKPRWNDGQRPTSTEAWKFYFICLCYLSLYCAEICSGQIYHTFMSRVL